MVRSWASFKGEYILASESQAYICSSLSQPPANATIGPSSALSADCIGRINGVMGVCPTSSFEYVHTNISQVVTGNQNNTGMCNSSPQALNADDDADVLTALYGNTRVAANSTQLIGYPNKAVVVSLSIQASIVAASVEFDLYYPTVNASVPLQVDMWLSFADDLKIEAYDINARRLKDVLAYIHSKLVPRITKEMHVTGDLSNVTNVIAQKAAADICTAAERYCTIPHYNGSSLYSS